MNRGKIDVMRVRSSALLAALVISVAALAQPAPEKIDTSRIGPQVGATVPPFSGVDQFGTPRTLASTLGPKGAMLVFFRSADW